MNKKLLLLSILITGVTYASGGKEKPIKLGESVITTENFETTVRDTPANVSIVTAEEIEKSGARDLVDVLRDVPGIRVVRYAGTIKFDMRGTNSMYSDKNNLITLDGVPSTSSQIANLPLSMIKRIEIIPGGGNILYGDKAIGGVVNVLTKNPKNTKNYGSVITEFGSYQNRKVGATYGTKLGKNLLVDFGYIRNKNHGWRHGEDFENNSANFRAKYLLNNGDIEYKYTYTQDKDLRGVAVPRVVTDNDRKNPGVITGSKYKSQDHYLTFRKEITPKTEVLIYGNYYDRKNRWYDRKNRYFASDDEEIKQYVKAQVKHTYGEKNYFIFGTDYLKDRLKPNSSTGKIKEVTGLDDDGNKITKKKYVKTGDSKKENFGMFLMNRIFEGDFQFTQGVRYDRATYDYFWRNGTLNNWSKIGTSDSVSYDDFSYELSTNYLYSDTGSIYFSYNRAFRTPTVGEIRYTRNSEKLDPQIQDTFEIGLKDFIDNTYISVATFYKRTHHEIYSTIPPEFKGMVNYNIGKTERIGFELYGEHYIGKLTLKSSVTYIKTKVLNGKYKDSEIPSVPNWKLTAGATYNFTENLASSVDLLYYSESYDLDDIKNERAKDTGEYATVDVSTYYQITPSIMLTARIENIFDKKYDEYAGYWDDDYYSSKYVFRRQYYPAIGRVFTVGATYTF